MPSANKTVSCDSKEAPKQEHEGEAGIISAKINAWVHTPLAGRLQEYPKEVQRLLICDMYITSCLQGYAFTIQEQRTAIK